MLIKNVYDHSYHYNGDSSYGNEKINGNKWETSPDIPDTMPDIATIIFNTTSKCISQMKMFLEIKSTSLLTTTINKVNKNI